MHYISRGGLPKKLCYCRSQCVIGKCIFCSVVFYNSDNGEVTGISGADHELAGSAHAKDGPEFDRYRQSTPDQGLADPK